MKKYLSLFGAGLLVLIGAIFTWHTNPAVGSVTIANDYQSTTTSSTAASASAGWQACSSRAAFGSIVVNQVGTAGYVRVWDATSTATSSYQSQATSSSSPKLTLGRPIAQILGTSDAATTLTYDASAHQGLVVETSSGFDGQYTITYRCY